jgi:hypothetical protein
MDQLRHVASQFEDSSGIPGRKAPQVFRRTTVQYSMPAAKNNHELEYGQNEHQNSITTPKCSNNCLQHPDTKLDTLQLLL